MLSGYIQTDTTSHVNDNHDVHYMY